MFVCVSPFLVKGGLFGWVDFSGLTQLTAAERTYNVAFAKIHKKHKTGKQAGVRMVFPVC